MNVGAFMPVPQGEIVESGCRTGDEDGQSGPEKP